MPASYYIIWDVTMYPDPDVPLLLSVAPELGHVFESLALGLRNKLPDEEGCDDTDDAIEAVGEPVAETIALCKLHVEHGHK